MELKRTWVTSKDIIQVHKNFPVRQIYLWLVTLDNKIPLVAGSSKNFQLPGGKPEINESREKTLKREMFEETGITLDFNKHHPEFFGYYLIESDPNPKWDGTTYLQLRYFLKFDVSSEDIELSTNEREGDLDVMQEVEFVDMKSVSEFLPYLKDSREYFEVEGLLKPST